MLEPLEAFHANSRCRKQIVYARQKRVYRDIRNIFLGRLFVMSGCLAALAHAEYSHYQAAA